MHEWGFHIEGDPCDMIKGILVTSAKRCPPVGKDVYLEPRACVLMYLVTRFLSAVSAEAQSLAQASGGAASSAFASAVASSSAMQGCLGGQSQATAVAKSVASSSAGSPANAAAQAVAGSSGRKMLSV